MTPRILRGLRATKFAGGGPNAGTPEKQAAMTDILVASLKAGLTNVVTYSIDDLGTPITGLPGNETDRVGIHPPGHDEAFGGVPAWKTREQIRISHVNQIKKIVEELKKVPEGKGTMFDNTMIMHFPENGAQRLRAHREGSGRRATIIPSMAGTLTSQQRLATIEAAVENSDEAVLITDARLALPGPTIVYVNGAFCRMTRRTRAQLLGKTPRIFQGPKTDGAVIDRLRRNLAAGEAFEGETVNYRSDGTEYLLHWRIDPVRNGKGVITHWVSVQRDVTRQRADERELRERKRRFQLLAEAVEDFVVLSDLDGRTLFANSAMLRAAGCGPDDLSAEAISNTIHRSHRGAYEQARVRARRGEASIIECRLSIPGARRRRYELRETPVCDETGAVEMTLLTGRNITDRVRAERERAARISKDAEHRRALASQRNWEALARAAAAMGAGSDSRDALTGACAQAVPALADACLFDLNEDDGSMIRIAAPDRWGGAGSGLRIDPAKGLRSPPTGLEELKVHPTDAGEIAAALGRDMKERRVLARLRPTAAISVRMSARGRTIGTLHLVMCDPRRQFGLEEMSSAEQLARQAALAVDNFRLLAKSQRNEALLGSLAVKLSQTEDTLRAGLARDLHDTVAQNLSLVRLNLDRRDADTSQADSLAQARKLVDDTVSLVRNLVFDLYPSTLDLHGLAAALESLAGRMRTTVGAEISVTETGRRRVLAPEIRRFLYRAARELLANVVKHSGTKKASVAVDQDGDRVRLTVSDSGCGFDPVASAGAAGFGLLDLRERVHAMKGKVSIESRRGCGTSVLIELPLTE